MLLEKYASRTPAYRSDITCRCIYTLCTVKPLNKGHLGDIESVLYSDVSDNNNIVLYIYSMKQNQLFIEKSPYSEGSLSEVLLLLMRVAGQI